MPASRSFFHLTPRYVFSRVLQLVDVRMNPTHPWLTKDAVSFLAQTLKPDDVGVEFGSGRSTHWFAARIGHLASVESDPVWHAAVGEKLRQDGLADKVDCRLCKAEDEYNAQAATFADASIDFCLVDGAFTSSRGVCARDMLPKLRANALIVVDNVNWYLPNDITRSPGSRRTPDGFQSDEWRTFAGEVATWRRYWTSNGVADTCIWIKP